MPFRKPIYGSPQEVEKAFYDAIQHADLEALMATWAEDEEIICILPGGSRLAGYTSIRDMWRRIFESGRRFTITLSHKIVQQNMLISVHNVIEQISMHEKEKIQTAQMLATNVFIRSALGWRMLIHHVSPTLPETPDEVPKILH